ncbi:MAG: hypothetical protein ACOVRM_07860, partial [Planctomycetaceae bacterium]
QRCLWRLRQSLSTVSDLQLKIPVHHFFPKHAGRTALSDICGNSAQTRYFSTRRNTGWPTYRRDYR